MESDIETIFKSVDTIILKHLMINDSAMKLTQSWGYNGFKRLHRVKAKKMLCEHLKLENCMFDKYRTVLETDVKGIEYSPSNIKYHISQMKETLESDIRELGKLNYKHIELVGISNSVIECVLECFMHDYEKMCRWFARFNESSWNSIDLRLLDDQLHSKYKKIEEGE
jgi:hypothetical protein